MCIATDAGICISGKLFCCLHFLASCTSEARNAAQSVVLSFLVLAQLAWSEVFAAFLRLAHVTFFDFATCNTSTCISRELIWLLRQMALGAREARRTPENVILVFSPMLYVAVCKIHALLGHLTYRAFQILILRVTGPAIS